MSDNKEQNYYLKKYWKAWVGFSSIFLLLILLHEFVIEFGGLRYFILIIPLVVPAIFYYYALFREKGN
ncbi:hypothetical protein F9U64_10660 [Gracilibacillus oryzae]|uniref:Uncharacterized protein n=1 Tax=Gracilibacillus oryzae TaxID=1672701 RepID=A0A7C8GT34_9BACI|nr:hypothetical protein [Gracilibacillus oryzae]KAB8135728.1 hypothetical protein F9U64_10660 [Gracilibacillus oryzae]